MGLRTPAITANARPSRVGVSGRYPVIPPIKLPVLRTTENRCSCADFYRLRTSRTRPELITGFSITLCVGNQRCHQFQNVLFLNGYRQMGYSASTSES